MSYYIQSPAGFTQDQLRQSGLLSGVDGQLTSECTEISQTGTFRCGVSISENENNLKKLVQNLKAGRAGVNYNGVLSRLWDPTLNVKVMPDGSSSFVDSINENPVDYEKGINDRVVMTEEYYKKLLKLVEAKIKQFDPNYSTETGSINKNESAKPHGKTGANSSAENQTFTEFITNPETWVNITKTFMVQLPGILSNGVISGVISYLVFKNVQKNSHVSAQAASVKADQKKDWLTDYSQNINEKVKRYEENHALGRDAQIKRTIDILTANFNIDPTKHKGNLNTPLYIGEAGAGKSSGVEGLAWLIEKKDPSVSSLHGYTILAIDLKKLDGGEGGKVTVGDQSRALRNIISQAQSKFGGKIILFFDEAQVLMDMGKHSASEIGIVEFLKSEMAEGRLLSIFGTTQAEYDKHIKPNTAFASRLQKVYFEQLPNRVVVEILKNALKGRTNSPVQIAPAVLERIPDLAKIWFEDSGANPRASLTMLTDLIGYATGPVTEEVLNQYLEKKIQQRKRSQAERVVGEILELNGKLRDMGYPELVKSVPESNGNVSDTYLRELRLIKGSLASEIQLIIAHEERGLDYATLKKQKEQTGQTGATHDLAKWQDIRFDPIDGYKLHEILEHQSPALGAHFYDVFASGNSLTTMNDLLTQIPREILNKVYAEVVSEGRTLKSLGGDIVYKLVCASAASSGIRFDRDESKLVEFRRALNESEDKYIEDSKSRDRLSEHRDSILKNKKGK